MGFDPKGNTQSGNELLQSLGGIAEKIKSNLSETALIVKGMMDKYISPLLEKENLIPPANQISQAKAAKKITSGDPMIIDFASKCRDVQSTLYQQAQADGCDSKQLAVVNNYFSRLVNGMQIEEEVPAKIEQVAIQNEEIQAVPPTIAG
ncbi:MAG: hypothetical protein AAB373_02380 [Patescibacteria group bacterium]